MSDTRPLRVLVTTDAVGGVWSYALDLARGLVEEGIEPLLALTGPAPSPAQRADATGIRLVETGVGLDWLEPDAVAVAAAARRIAELAGDHAVDVAHLNAPAIATARFAMPTLAVTHSCLGTWWRAVKDGPLPADFAWRDTLTRDGLLAATHVAAPSRAHAEATRVVHRLPSAPSVIHNGRAPSAASGATPPIRASFTAGRLWDEGKGAAMLDAAAARLSAPFAAAGSCIGPQGETFAPRHLDRLGQLDAAALAARLAERPVFASAARYEPFGLAVLEAAQAGCALVLADTPVFRELWDGAARFVAAGDAAGFATAIEALLANPADRATAGHAARERSRRYTVAAMARATARLYRTIMDEGRVAA